MSEVHLVTPAETRALRQRVLRPHLTVEEVAATDDDVPNIACYDERGVVVACATVRAEPEPGRELASAWRLRGMASDPELRGRGYGAAVLTAAVDHVRAAGGTELWCNARIAARGFYERHGWTAVGDVWDEPVIGPHVRMRLPV